MTSHERQLEVSSRLWDRTQRSCVIRIMTVESAGFSSHGVSTTVDTSDQMLLTPGCTCLWHTIVQCYEGTCWLTYTAWTGYVVVLEANGGRRAWSWPGHVVNFRLLVISRATAFNTDWSGHRWTIHRHHRGHCCSSPCNWRSRRALVSSQHRWSESDILSGAVKVGRSSSQHASSRCLRTVLTH